MTIQMAGIVQSQRKMMRQLDNLIGLVREGIGGGPGRGKSTVRGTNLDIDASRLTLISAALAAGGLGLFLFKAFLPRN